MRRFSIVAIFLFCSFPILSQDLFKARRDYVMRAECVTSGDFNGDDIADLAIASYNRFDQTGSVGIMIGRGDGTFESPTDIPVGTWQPSYLVVGDFNNDAISDLAIGNVSGGVINILLGDGSGNFRRRNFERARVKRMIVEDINNDGNQDLLTVGIGLSVVLGDGAGNLEFPFGVRYSFFDDPRDLVADDFDGDGNLDVVVANAGSNNVSLHFGDGTGRFEMPVYYDVGASPRSLALADFNNDSILDIAVSNSGSNDVSILISDGLGAFSAADNYPLGKSPNDIVIGDFNGDGAKDIAVSSFERSNMSILLGDGGGQFNNLEIFDMGALPRCLIAADFNLDGSTDLTATGIASMSIIISDGPRGLLAAPSFSLTAFPRSGLFKDFDHDGNFDFAVVNRPNELNMYLGTGNGKFMEPVKFEVGEDPIGVAGADFNHDDYVDIVTLNRQDASVSLLVNQNGSFEPDITHQVATGSTSIEIGDFNGDGDLDIITVGRDISVSLGDGSGKFLNPITTMAEIPKSGETVSTKVLVGSFNHDAISDIITFSDRFAVSYLGDGNGGFVFKGRYELLVRPPNSAPTSEVVDAVAGDFNNDGNLDLATVDLLQEETSVILGDGQGGFGLPQSFSSNLIEPYSIGTSDFDGDGNLDIAVANTFDVNNISVWLGDGIGGFGFEGLYGAGGFVTKLVTLDFDGNGMNDLAALSTNLNILLNRNGLWYLDNDGDGFGDPNSTLVSIGRPAGYVANADDCDDANDQLNIQANCELVTALPPDQSGRLKIYPNPAQDWIRLENPEGERFEYQIFDLSGRLVLAGEVENNSISLVPLKPGHYILQLSSGFNYARYQLLRSS